MQFFIENKLVVKELLLANTFFARLKGLMFKKDLPIHKGVLLSPCNSVHTFFMNFNIDVVYLDQDLIIKEVFYNVSPRKVLPIRKDCKNVLEVKAGVLSPNENILNKKCSVR